MFSDEIVSCQARIWTFWEKSAEMRSRLGCWDVVVVDVFINIVDGEVVAVVVIVVDVVLDVVVDVDDVVVVVVVVVVSEWNRFSSFER